MEHSTSDLILEATALTAAGMTARAAAMVSAAIEREPQPELLAFRAQLTMTAAEDAPGDDLRSQLEWLSSPAGQQNVAIGRERALADLDAALAKSDNIDWRLLRGDLLLDGGRFDEAEAEFAAVLARAGVLPPDEADLALQRAQLGLELARRRDDGAAELLEAWHDVAALLSEHDPVDERASRVAQSLANVHADVPERFAPFDPLDLDRPARRFYDDALDALRRQGYELCADVEPLRNTEQSGPRTLLRLALSADRLTAAAIWRLVGTDGAVEAIELESALEDGSFLRTNNLGTTNPFEQPPQIAQLSLPPGIDAAMLVAAHRERLTAAQARPVPTPDLAAVIAGQERQRVLKREFARSRGWVTEAELRGLLGASYDELAGPVRRELARLLR